MRADLAVPGGPWRNRCSPATIANAMRSITSSRPTKRLLSTSTTSGGDGRRWSRTRTILLLTLVLPLHQFYVLQPLSSRPPGRFFVLDEPFGIKQQQPGMVAEVQRCRWAVIQVGNHSGKRPSAQHRRQVRRQPVGGIQCTCAGGQAADSAASSRRRGGWPASLARQRQAFVQFIGRILMIDEKPAGIPQQLRGGQPGFRCRLSSGPATVSR